MQGQSLATATKIRSAVSVCGFSVCIPRHRHQDPVCSRLSVGRLNLKGGRNGQCMCERESEREGGEREKECEREGERMKQRVREKGRGNERAYIH